MKEGSRVTIHIDGFHVPYITPPVPKLSEIAGHNLPQKQQKWIRPVFPSDEDAKLMPKSEVFEIIKTDLIRRIEGYWFMNNGVPTYITGSHYFTLTHWYMAAVNKDGYPEYRNAAKLWFYTKDIADKDENCFGLIMMCQKRFGKALDINTPIPTPGGWTIMKDLQVGDYVFGADGKPTKITFESGIQYNRNCYKVIFSDGSEIIADEEHRWLASNAKDRASTSWLRAKNKGKVYPEKVVTTREMAESIKSQQGFSNWAIKNTLEVQYPKNELSIPPYILGIWLGDGSSSYTKLTNVDADIIESWVNYGKSIGLGVVKDQDITYMLTPGRTGVGGKNPLLLRLRGYDLINNKHIPLDYLQSSISDRVELLRGLMDTDGCKLKQAQVFEFCSKREVLAKNVKQLVESLGMKCTLTEKYNKKVQKTYYYVRFGSYKINPFKLKRKSDLFGVSNRVNTVLDYRYIVDIVPVETRPVKCIQVDNDNHTYLCGESYIVTHNTEYELADMYNKATRGGIRMLKGLVIEDKDCLFGMQSLTATEAKNNLFKSRLMRSHMKIQRYLKPESNETGSKREIVGELTFKGTNIGGGKYKDALRNVIDHRPTLVSAYQGKRPRQIFIDEPGSIEEMDLENWWTTVKEQLALGTKAFGKAFLPTTLETMTPRGADAFKKIWEESDPNKRDPNGRTTSGLYRYFKAQYLGREDFVDEYGNDLIEEAKQFRANQLENASPSQQQKIKRQYPETVEEAFGLIIGGVWEDDVKESLVADEALCAKSIVKYVTLRMSNGAIVESFAPKTDEAAIKILETPLPNTIYSLGIDSATTDDETGDSGGSKIAAVVTKGAGEGACMYSPTIAYSERALNKEACYHKIFLIARYIIDKGGILKITGEINGGGADCFRYLCNRGLKPYMTGTPKQYANSSAGDKTGQFWLYVGPDLLKFLHGLGNRFLRFCHEHGTGIKILSVARSLIKYKGGSNEDEASAYLISLWNFRDFDKFEKKAKKAPVKMPKFNQDTGMWEG